MKKIYKIFLDSPDNCGRIWYNISVKLSRKKNTVRLSQKGGLVRQSNNRKNRDETAFLYERLSRDDNLEGESYSIGNQKKLLAKVAKEKGYTNLVHFLDEYNRRLIQ